MSNLPTSEEKFIFVNAQGRIVRISPRRHCAPGEYLSVVLVLVFLPNYRQLVLFNRAAGASDMQDRWALIAGKMNSEDCREIQGKVIGRPISFQIAVNAAIRELKEELNNVFWKSSFEKISEFIIQKKNLHFWLMALPIDEEQATSFLPNKFEISAIKRFSLDEFRSSDNFGDAILMVKGVITSYLEEQFSRSIKCTLQ